VTLAGLIVAVAQAALVVAGAPFLVGLVRTVRARLEGRVGAGVGQPWRDLRKLWRKERIRPQHTSWIFSATPLVLASTSLVVAAIVPFASTRSGLDEAGDLFAVVALFLAGTVFLALAGLDPGTAFGGMGSSREMTIAALAEPTLLVAVFALSVRAGSSNLSAIMGATLAHPDRLASPGSLLAAGALAMVILAEAGRLPVDNPATHLELTMIHEAMILEYAGPDLALVEGAAHMRLAVLLALLANLFVPWGIATTTRPLEVLVGATATGAKVAFLGVVLATFEVFVAKLRLFRVPELLAASFVLAFLAVTASFFLP
jgi:formate hydrogenlyase subunit 4